MQSQNSNLHAIHLTKQRLERKEKSENFKRLQDYRYKEIVTSLQSDEED